MRIDVGAEELTLPYATTFGDVPVGRELAFIGSRGLVSLAVNQGNFARSHGVTLPVTVVVLRK